jgi:hypothetical protein
MRQKPADRRDVKGLSHPKGQTTVYTVNSAPSTSDKRIRGHSGLKNLLGAFHASYRKVLWIDQFELHEHRSLVPIDILVGQLPLSKANDHETILRKTKIGVLSKSSTGSGCRSSGANAV